MMYSAFNDISKQILNESCKPCGRFWTSLLGYLLVGGPSSLSAPGSQDLQNEKTAKLQNRQADAFANIVTNWVGS